MTERLRELIDEVVWSTDDTQCVTAQTRIIIKKHVLPMAWPGPILSSLRDWAEKQAQSHGDKASKLDSVILGMIKHNVVVSSVQVLCDHHRRISGRYKTVLSFIWMLRVAV
jgi:hypothetical protein